MVASLQVSQFSIRTVVSCDVITLNFFTCLFVISRLTGIAVAELTGSF